jgi:hypothetical protein
MKRPIAVRANLPPADILIDAAEINGVNPQWLGGAFGVHLSFNNGNFVVVPQDQAAALEKMGALPAQ